MSGPAAITSTTGLLITSGFTLIGAIAGAVFGNWDKIFNKNKMVTAKVEGYAPTGNFEVEARYYFEVSGMRAQITELQLQILNSQESQLVAQFPQDQQLIAELMDIAEQSLPPLEEFLKLLIPIWQKFLSIDQIQELNKFYSTKTMQQMRDKQPLITEEYLPQALAVSARYTGIMGRRMDECVAAHQEGAGALPPA